MNQDRVDALLRERRGSFRLRFPMRMRPLSLYRRPDGRFQELDLIDLSRDGLSAEARPVDQWEKGDRLALKLDIDAPPLELDAEICWVRRRPNGVLVGVRFLGLCPTIGHRLDHCISNLQRYWLRTRIHV